MSPDSQNNIWDVCVHMWMTGCGGGGGGGGWVKGGKVLPPSSSSAVEGDPLFQINFHIPGH